MPSRKWGSLSVLDLLTHYPRRYLDRTTQVPISDTQRGRRGDRAGHGAARPPRCRRAGGPSRSWWSTCRMGSGYLSLSFFNQPWRAPVSERGDGGGRFGQGDDVPGPAADGQPFGRNGRGGMDGPGRPDLPSVGESRDLFHGDRLLHCRGAPMGWASSRTRCPAGPCSSTASPAGHGPSGKSTSPSRWAGKARLAGALVSTSCCACSSCW